MLKIVLGSCKLSSSLRLYFGLNEVHTLKSQIKLGMELL